MLNQLITYAMAEEAKNFLQKNFLTLANLFLLISLVVGQARWQERVDNRLVTLEKHTENTDVHQPFADKIKTFVPRTEIDSRLGNIEKSLGRIEKYLDDNK